MRLTKGYEAAAPPLPEADGSSAEASKTRNQALKNLLTEAKRAGQSLRGSEAVLKMQKS